MNLHRLALVAFAVLTPCAALAAESETKPNRPNVLFIVSDDLNTHLGCYGHKTVKSPNIDRLAARGTRFDHAYCQYPVCNPSRSSFMTGVYPDQTRVLSNGGEFRRALPEVITLGQHFQNHDYFVARVGKIFHYGVPLQIGTDGADDPATWNLRVNPRGVDREVHDQIHTLQPGQFGGTLSWLELPDAAGKHTDELGADAAIELLEKHHPETTGKNFFLAVGFYRPHTPYVAPSRFFDLYDRDAIEPVLEVPGDRDDMPRAAIFDRPHQRELTIEKRREIIEAYYASISLMDAQVGRLLDALDRLKLTDNTVIVFTSDHGYHLGAHGMWQKSDLFEEGVRVPLVVVDPRRDSQPKTSAALVEMVDIYPTITAMCGLEQAPHVLGHDLGKVIDDPAARLREAAFTTTMSRNVRNCQGYTIRTDRYRYTIWDGGEQGSELYDYETDPQELTNLIESPDHADVIKRHKQLMEAAIKRANTPVAQK
jgi:arylsulfatase A-like enzyme